ncbi:ubiquitin carboxyl-terminal hydrolase 8-like isoform X2 [Phoenix dactylifera]|uniref:Ubiquitin carboxyl-terminal hydrolase n=1 Tax=Phoenix dactylifera TaxID=42345 RepID=A0A8B8J8F0_PHODC|nr:ubiquitin carboxyl-terminal hydrolase 8-like isoform X2 [Phoenix dactylifera]XP_026663207.2 ubiquitin carboxyl-terminal hydrolase 8-like isoform X2 [Phoenix dactylifera]XP_026663208.2 ubiquitin carboxyl-terminal hydrolase 8-like isoform X2 [Phoenix dactylifera]
MDVLAANSDHPPAAEDDRVFLVPYRWWREAQELEAEDGPRGIPYTATPVSSSYGMKLINNFFSSDLVFNLRRDDDMKWNDAEVGVSGRCYALISWYKWSWALQWHSASNSTMKTIKNLSFTEDGVTDVYPVMLRISVTRESNILTVKIGKKDNTVENYKRASKIFSVDSEPVRIWDFCGHINLILMNEWNRLPQDCQRHTDQEILLSIQVYALTEPMACRSEVKKDDLALQQSKMTSFSCCGSLVTNGSIRNMESEFHAGGNLKGISSLGLTGLENLGNTCFMNSAIQCLAHTPKLVDYFLGDYSREINQDNQLGMNGELALAFGDLLRKLWAHDKTPVVPRSFKAMLARFAPQFSGFNQHDSQELLAFLLDGLHEDLNRVKCKPYLEAKDACGRPDEIVADEYWKNHLARNDSIIVDICQGQYKSTLVCPVCNKVSVTFDPFMYLSLPLPSTTMRTMTVSVLCTDGSLVPSPYTINVPKSGKCKDLIQALSIACSLEDDESLLVAEVYAGRIIRYLEEPSDSLSLLRDGDQLAAYRLPKDLEKAPMVVFMHQRMEEYYILGKMTSRWQAFGFPLIAKLPDTPSGSTICKLFLKLLNSFRRSKDIALDDDRDNCRSASFDEIAKMDASSCKSGCKSTADAGEENEYMGDEFELYLTDEKGQVMESKIEMNEPLLWTGLQKQLHILVRWKDKSLDQYDKSLLNSLPEIYKYGLFAKRLQDSFTLYACLEAFLKEEPLGPEDMWYCPCCRKHQQASKKLDLWRLPEVLVIHLKRFSYNRFMKNKLETFVEFPIHDLDLSAYVAHRTEHPSHHYRLYAVSNHYGNMEGGHYTAYIHHEGHNEWYDFDDRHVVPISEDSVKMSAAYVLFYRRT